ncbi:MAG: hypothetical protein ACMXYC_00625, partial [Candidatus Woesearchaeota archaeon]
SKKSKQTISSTTTIQEKRSHKPSLHEVLQKYSTKKDTDASHLKAHVSSHVNDVAHTADGKSSSQNATGDTTHHASKHMVKDFLQKLHLKSSSDKHNVSAHTQHQHEQADNNVATHAQHNVHTQQQEAVDSLAYQRHQHTNNNNTNDAHTNHIHNEHTTHTHIPEHTTGTQQPQHAWNKISAVVLKKFVAYQKQQGLDDEHIKEVLREHGFEESDIRHVFT